MFSSARTMRSGLIAVAILATGLPANAATHGAQRHTLAGTKPGWATAAADREAADAQTTLSARVYLAGRDRDGLAAYARAVADPASPHYRHYLSPAAARARFGSTVDQVRAVTSWLGSAGLRTRAVNDDSIDVTGTVAAAAKAFGTGFDRYAVGGRTYRAPARDASVPARLAPDVLAVTGLDERPAIVRPTTAAMAGQDTVQPTVARERATTNDDTIRILPDPCSTHWGEKMATALPPVNGGPGPWEPCGYTPGQIRGAYGVDRSGLSGRGVTVAVVGAYDSPTMRTDASHYATDYGLPQFTPGQYIEDLPPAFTHTDGTCGPTSQWSAQQSINVDAIHTMAPAARIRYVASASCQVEDLIVALRKVVDQRSADLVAATWYWPFASAYGDLTSSIIQPFTRTFQLGAVEGIGFYFSTGDCADLDPANENLICEPATGSTRKQTEYPASDPWVTAVGGTSIAIGSHSDYLFETGEGTTLGHELPDASGWVTPSVYQVMGGGGGVSDYFDQPFYQRQAVPAKLAAGASGGPRRVVPDVAMVADYFTSGRYGQTLTLPDGESAYVDAAASGTGLATSLFVGVQADAQEAQHGIPLGFANPAIYRRARLGLFHDVVDRPFGADKPPTIIVHNTEEDANAAGTLGHDSGLVATRGFDDVTGLGSPTLGYLRSYR